MKGDTMTPLSQYREAAEKQHEWFSGRPACDWYNHPVNFASMAAESAERMVELLDYIDESRDLLRRALAIITDAIMHGMPVSEEVADVRNQIVQIVATAGVPLEEQ